MAVAQSLTHLSRRRVARSGGGGAPDFMAGYYRNAIQYPAVNPGVKLVYAESPLSS